MAVGAWVKLRTYKDLQQSRSSSLAKPLFFPKSPCESLELSEETKTSSEFNKDDKNQRSVGVNGRKHDAELEDVGALEDRRLRDARRASGSRHRWDSEIAASPGRPAGRGLRDYGHFRDPNPTICQRGGGHTEASSFKSAREGWTAQVSVYRVVSNARLDASSHGAVSTPAHDLQYSFIQRRCSDDPCREHHNLTDFRTRYTVRTLNHSKQSSQLQERCQNPDINFIIREISSLPD